MFFPILRKTPLLLKIAITTTTCTHIFFLPVQVLKKCNFFSCKYDDAFRLLVFLLLVCFCCFTSHNTTTGDYFKYLHWSSSSSSGNTKSCHLVMSFSRQQRRLFPLNIFLFYFRNHSFDTVTTTTTTTYKPKNKRWSIKKEKQQRAILSLKYNTHTQTHRSEKNCAEHSDTLTYTAKTTTN